MKPEQLDEKVERLQYFIEDKKNGKGLIALAWEKLHVAFDIQVK